MNCYAFSVTIHFNKGKTSTYQSHSDYLMPETQGPPKNLGYQLTLFGPRGADYARHITAGPPSFWTMRRLWMLMRFDRKGERICLKNIRWSFLCVVLCPTHTKMLNGIYCNRFNDLILSDALKRTWHGYGSSSFVCNLNLGGYLSTHKIRRY